MNWNLNYAIHFLVGLILLLFSALVFYYGQSNGFIFFAQGGEAYLKASMYMLVSFYLISLIFVRKDENPMTWIQSIGGLLGIASIEILAHLVFFGLHF